MQALLLLAMLQGAAAAAPQVTARITPEAVGVGEAVTVELRVRAPLGSEVRFPAMPDSSEAVEALDPRSLRDASTATMLDRTASYRLVAWDTGARRLQFGDIVVEREGREQRYRVSLPMLRVRSVLPAERDGRVPRPPRELLRVAGWWWRLAVGAAVVLLLIGFGWRAWRRRLAVGERERDASDLAARRFGLAERLGLLEAGEPGRFALNHVDVMREYLAARFPQAGRSRTTGELTAALAGAAFPILPERVTDLLRRCEPIAFAGAAVDEATARAIASEARSIVGDVEMAWRNRAAAAASRPKRRR